MSAVSFFRKPLAGLGLVLSLVAATASAQLPDYTGRPIVELIEALRNQGVRIVYGRDLLPSRLRVESNPGTNDSFAALREILTPHGLDIERGPNDTWIVTGTPTPAPTAGGLNNSAAPQIQRPSLETVIVTASRYPIERQASVSANAFARHTLETTPALGQDPLRVTHRLPGVTSDQLTSRMHIRGGTLDEVLLKLDGVRLFSPFHLKDFQNIFSSINPRIIDSMDVRTGGYEARFGDRMSGVIDMKSIEPEAFRNHELGVSFLETSVLSSGLFGNGGGSWVTSLRRGNLDVLAKTGDSDIGTPQYVDFFNKLEFSPTARIRVRTGILSLDDKISLNDGDVATAAADYDDTYYWASLDRSSPSGMESSFLISSANLNRTRVGSISDAARATGSLTERSAFDRVALSTDWSRPLSDSVSLSWGGEFAETDLAHFVATTIDERVPLTSDLLGAPASPPSMADVRLSQHKRAVYAEIRYQPIDRLVMQAGIRRDSQSLIGEHQTGPRLNLLLDIGDRTSLRAAWGRFAQAESLSEIAVSDGMTTLQNAQETNHAIIGVDHMFGDSGFFRAEVYEKRATDLNTRFENLLERVSLIPEVLPDRFAVSPVSARTRGIEFSVENRHGAFAWWANMALARTWERLATGDYRRSWDERRSMKAGAEWTGSRWEVTTTLTYRSGWPISRIQLVNDEVVIDSFNGIRLPRFSSADFRASRRIETDRGELNWFIEIGNLFNHSNFCCIDYAISFDGANVANDLSYAYDELLGVLPNLGIRWQF